jgi:hypothetical protein
VGRGDSVNAARLSIGTWFSSLVGFCAFSGIVHSLLALGMTLPHAWYRRRSGRIRGSGGIGFDILALGRVVG